VLATEGGGGGALCDGDGCCKRRKDWWWSSGDGAARGLYIGRGEGGPPAGGFSWEHLLLGLLGGWGNALQIGDRLYYPHSF